MFLSELQLPFKKSLRNSREKKQILNNGVKILVKSYFIHEKIQKSFNFSEEEELEFITSLELKKPLIKNKGVV